MSSKITDPTFGGKSQLKMARFLRFIASITIEACEMFCITDSPHFDYNYSKTAHFKAFGMHFYPCYWHTLQIDSFVINIGRFRHTETQGVCLPSKIHAYVIVVAKWGKFLCCYSAYHECSNTFI